MNINPTYGVFVDMTVLTMWITFLMESKGRMMRILFSALIAITVCNIAFDAVKITASLTKETRAP